MRILNYISVPTPKQGTRAGRRVTGFRGVTLVGARGKILAYADKVAVDSRTIGFSRVTFGRAVLPPSPGVRVREATLLDHARPRLRLFGLSLTLPDGVQRVSGSGWACDAAIGTFRRCVRLPAQAETRRRAKG